MKNKELLILVDEQDNPCGHEEKMLVHELGLLHRAFSIFIFNLKGELLLQQRSLNKYHSGGLWTNTCCSHPRFEEDINSALKRRLAEEMGMTCETAFAFHFIYKHVFDNQLTEHEFDHVYFGISDEQPKVNPEEVQAWKYISLETLSDELRNSPEKYTPWLKICIDKVITHTKTNTLTKHLPIHHRV